MAEALRYGKELVLLVESGIVRWASPASEHALGRDSQRLVREWPEWIHPLDREPIRRWFTLPAAERSTSMAVRCRTANGPYRVLDFTLQECAPEGPLRGCIIVHGRDVTDRTDQEERSILRAQKLESLGLLAGGVAHDFNNLLAVMLGNVSLAEHSLPTDSPARGFLADMEFAVRRASDLTRQLLAYAGKGKFMVRELDLNQVILDMTHLLGVSVSKKVSLQYRLGSDLPLLQGDLAQIQQVIMNLVINASEAIGDQSGLVTLSTGAQDLTDEYVATTLSSDALRPGRYVVLEVSDTGCGMTSDVMSRMFDPFFSTKFSGRGLGLSAVSGIVRSHGGGVKVYSEVGKGSNFKLFLPASTGALPATERRAPVSDRPAGGTVLLVDDDENVRRTTSYMLQCLGFAVLEAADGADAVKRFREASSSVDVVLLDLTMPTLDGKETFRALREIRSSVKVILSSGYNEQDTIAKFVGKGLAGFLQKPYGLEELRGALERVLQQ